MALRVQAAQANAFELAEVLKQHPVVTKVNYLSLSDTRHSCPEIQAAAQLHFSQAKGGGSVLSFETGDVAVSRAFVAAAAHPRGGLFKQTVSFGSVSSLVEMPMDMSHASIPEEMQHFASDLIRLSIGIEDSTDLVRALSSALAAAQAVSTRSPEHYVLGGREEINPRKAAISAKKGADSLPFGVSLPPKDAHAVGVSMPRWEDVINYEEGCEITHNKLESGYPRFVFLQPVQRLHATAASLFGKTGEEAIALPSARAAIRLQKFMLAGNCTDISVHDFFANGVFAVTFPARYAGNAKAYWQHCGEIVSSRLAEETLEIVAQTCWENTAASSMLKGTMGPAAMEWPGRKDTASGNASVDDVMNRRTSSDPNAALTRRIAALAGVDRGDTFTYPTGMAAVAAAHRLLKLASDWDEVPLRNIVFGFPYLDTLKLNSRPELGSGVVFYGNGDAEDLESLRNLLESGERIGGLFCEFPSNPLLRSPDLKGLRAIADEYGFPIVVDDTVVGFNNADVLGKDGADILVSSLTKQFSGSNNAMGGSLVLNPEAPFYSRLQARLTRDYEPLLWKDDAATLLSGSSDYEARAMKTNENITLALTLTLIRG